MNVLLVDVGGNMLDFALQCKKANHHVLWFIAPGENGERLPIGDGMGIEKVNTWQQWMKWSDLTLTSDNTRYMTMLEPYRKLGYPIFGCNVAGAEMELDREIGQKVFKDCGIDTLPYKTFYDYDTAIAFVKKTMKRYVSKPSGDANKALSFVSKDAKGMVSQLQRWKKLGKNKYPFILQEFCPGVEMAIGGWFGKNGWGAINENYEFKKLLNGNLGCNTGEVGTVMRYVDKSKLADKVLFPCSDYLLSIGYTGYIDVAVIIDEVTGIPYPMEFTARDGWPHFQIISSLNKGDPAEWIADLLDGYDSIEVSKDVATGVVLFHGDFPYNTKPRKESSGFPVYCTASNPNIHFSEVMMGLAPQEVNGKIVDEPTIVTAGTYVLIATGTDSTVSGSAKKAYGLLKEIETPNSPGYRTDVGVRLKKEISIMNKFGYSKGLVY